MAYPEWFIYRTALKKRTKETEDRNGATIIQTTKKWQWNSLGSYQLNVWHPNWPFQLFPGGHLSPGWATFWEAKNYVYQQMISFQHGGSFIRKCNQPLYLITAQKSSYELEFDAYWERKWTFRHRANSHKWAPAHYRATNSIGRSWFVSWGESNLPLWS